jgi:flagellar biosynthesis protein FlhF
LPETAIPSDPAAPRLPAAELQDFRLKIREDLLAAQEEASSLLEQLIRPSTAAQGRQAFPALAARLQESGVTPVATARWLDRLAAELACDPECHAERLGERLEHIIAGELPVRGPIPLAPRGATVVALVGPTGVGKTTTLAKLAAHFRLREERSVALIAADTFRIAAVEQLRAYAEMLDLPMEMVRTPAEMSRAIERLAPYELILMDTTGASPRDQERLDDLAGMLGAAKPHETVLVLSATATGNHAANAARRFGQLGATSLILTKLDEASDWGSLLESLVECRLPLVYTSAGQNVPHDFESASALALARLLVGST